jgi:RNA polymerase sigma-70 factor, ECF subfamily
LINSSLEFLKKKKRVIPIEQVQLAKQSYHPFQNTDDKIDLFNLIEGIDEKYKTVLILRFYKDMSVKQIAEFLHCPEGTVKTNIHRAIHLLKSQLGEGKVNER